MKLNKENKTVLQRAGSGREKDYGEVENYIGDNKRVENA